VEALSHRPVIVTIENADTDAAAIRRACEAYSAIDYQMNDEIGDSFVCLGLIGAQSEIVKRAQAVNAAKATLKALFAPLQRVRIRVPVKGSHTKAIPAPRVILRSIQRSDLNVNAADRERLTALDLSHTHLALARYHYANIPRQRPLRPPRLQRPRPHPDLRRAAPHVRH
jgi:hypothetical protein